MKRLIFVEGLPGTGKTTLSRWLSGLLKERGENVLLLPEGDERIPLDFYETAGVPIAVFETYRDKAPFYIAGQTQNYVYVRMDKCPGPAADLVRPWDMGDECNMSISVPAYVHCALERLADWASGQQGTDQTVIIDSGFLQNPVNELLFRKATDAQVRSFIGQIHTLCGPLHPVCVYLQRESAAAAIAFAKKAKGEGWANRVDAMLKKSGCENLFEHRFDLELKLLEGIAHVKCPVRGDDWTQAKEKTAAFLLKPSGAA